MFESKTEIATGDFECKDIAGRLYLWTPKKHKPKRLIITAHGHRKTCHMFKIKREVMLNFYSSDKNSVQDPGLRKFYEGKAKPVETLSQGGSCYNYILSKYTNSTRNNSHNNKGESYQTINGLMAEDYMKKGRELQVQITDAYLDKMIGPNRYESMRKQALKYMKMKPAAILTIRNRRFKADVNLEWVLDVLHQKGYEFSRIDCLFCRNTLISAMIGSLPFGGSYSDKVVVT